MDQRFLDHYVDESFSLGNFVLSGGELASLCMADALLRQVGGVLGNRESAYLDSFAEGLDGKIEHPVYTRPAVFESASVPAVLLNGDHKAIESWKQSNCKLAPKSQS
jgi:tRNA (guanine37-N1)-methyltransferase